MKIHSDENNVKPMAKANDINATNFKDSNECDECGKKFDRWSRLIVHKKRHAIAGAEGPFECDECGKTFPQKSRLMRHTFMHSGEKPYACDVCGLRFAQKAHVKPHKRKHTGKIFREMKVY